MAQHDYVIDNSTGQNVRQDINNVLQAIASNNSGSSAPSTTYALQTFANTSTTKLQLRNASNNAFVDLRGFDGSLPLPDGTAVSPSLFFSDDINTGIFSGSGKEFNITTDGVERVSISSAGSIFNNTGADVDFRIEGDTDANLFFVDAGNNRVGIGTNNPTHLLHIESAPSPAIKILDTTNNTNLLIYSQDADSHIGTYSNHPLVFDTNSTEAFRITTTGNLLLGTTDDSTIGTINTNLVIGSTTNNDEVALTLNVMEGSNNRRVKFFLDDNDGVFGVDSTASTGVPSFVVRNSTNELIRVNSSSHILVGKTSSNSQGHGVEVRKEQIIIGKTASGTVNGIFFVHDTTYVGGLNYSNTSTSLATSSDERLKENILDADEAGTKIDSIKVRKFDWKIDGSHQEYGFVAQELETVFAHAVHTAEDDFKTKGVDLASLVPLLVKELQSLRLRVKELEAS